MLWVSGTVTVRKATRMTHQQTIMVNMGTMALPAPRSTAAMEWE